MLCGLYSMLDEMRKRIARWLYSEVFGRVNRLESDIDKLEKDHNREAYRLQCQLRDSRGRIASLESNVKKLECEIKRKDKMIKALREDNDRLRKETRKLSGRQYYRGEGKRKRDVNP